MLKNYLYVAIRTLRKQRGQTILNGGGLAVGIACFLLIALFVRYETSFDRYNTNADRIFRVGFDARLGDATFHAATSPAPMAETLRLEFGEVEQVARLHTFGGDVTVRNGDKQFVERRLYYADSTTFDVFTFPLLSGDPDDALVEPYSVVLTAGTARRYFGDEDALGKSVLINGVDHRVTGVMADVPSNSHIQFDLLAAMSGNGDALSNSSWGGNNFHTYVLLRNGVDWRQFEAKLDGLVQRYVGPMATEFIGTTAQEFLTTSGFRYFLQPLTRIHLYSDVDFELGPGGNIATIYAATVIALLVLLIACINFINLATAQSAGRAREVGIRKSLGSNRSQLVFQFLVEATAISLLAVVASVAIVQAALPAFSNLTGTELSNDLFRDWRLATGLGVLAVVVGLLAGTYPAIVLSSFRPVEVLKGRFATGTRGTKLRNALVVLQFAVSTALVVCTAIVYSQTRFIRNQNLGFNDEQVLVLERAGRLGARRATFAAELLRQPGVASVSFADNLPGRTFANSLYHKEESPADEVESMQFMAADYDLIGTLGIQLVAGRDFSRSDPSDSSAVILNESAAAMLGWKDNPLGQSFTLPLSNDDGIGRSTVIGVVQDFHYESLHKRIQPLVVHLANRVEYAVVRLSAKDLSATLGSIEKLWHSHAPDEPFSYSFLDEGFNRLYAADLRAGRMFTAFTILAVLIACLGLFGLATFVIQQRTKEIGVRKVLGASVPGIVSLLSREFIVLVLVSTLIAWPAAFFAMQRWLESFAYRIDIGIHFFVFATVATLGIALLTVGYQSVRAAGADPIKSLRYE